MNNVKPTTVLVVDDFEPMRKVTTNVLRNLGIEQILTASNGAEALRMVKQQKVDLVLSDWNMPVMDGLEFLKTLRKNPATARMPFIMITAEAERHRVAEAIAHGVNALLVKPYTSGRLEDSVNRAMHRRREVMTIAAAGPPVIIPLAEPAAEPAPVIAAEPRRSTILVVDDTPENLHILSHLFKDDYTVRLAYNGTKALDICLSDTPPDLVLLDVVMPDIDGFEVLQRMRAHPNAEHIPVIFVTSLDGGASRIRGLELGAVDYVTKPIDPDIVKMRVRNLMRYVEVHRRLQNEYDGMLMVARLREDVEHMTRHDLKGSLAGVMGLIQSVANDDALNHRQASQLHLAEETALQLLGMINLSSELYKIETGRFVLKAEPVNISDILHRIVEIARASFAAKHLVIEADTDQGVGIQPPRALGDAMLCYSLFQNLLKNACEAAPENTRVSVALREGNPLTVAIENKGAVPLAIRAQFFDKFTTLGKQGGTGLGTYSARLLAEAQGGSIALEVSDEDDRTRLTVTLPQCQDSDV